MIRTAEIADIPGILAMGRLMLDESTYRGLDYDEHKISELLEKLIPEGGVFITEGGFMLGAISELWFNRQKIATDMGLFIVPEKRGQGLAIEFLTAYLDWAKAQGAREAYLGISTGVNVEATERLYSKFGFAKVGGLYKLRV